MAVSATRTRTCCHGGESRLEKMAAGSEAVDAGLTAAGTRASVSLLAGSGGVSPGFEGKTRKPMLMAYGPPAWAALALEVASLSY